MKPRRLLRLLPAAAALYGAGLLSGAALTANASDVPWDLLHVFSKALRTIDASYVDARDSRQLIYDAIGGLTQGLDDHSIFLSAEEYRELMEETRGEYYGVGVSIEVRGGEVRVVTPLDGSPAEIAGLLPGDVITAVDGYRVAEHGQDVVLGRIKGKRGTPVVITVLRPGEESEREFRVIRDRVRTRSVEVKLVEPGVGWLKIERFQSHTADEVRRGLARLKSDNGGRLTGLIVDLRDNPGGFLSQSVAVADQWVKEGYIVKTIGRHALEDEEAARAAGTDTETELVVLIDNNSASASEILAGALQDHGRALLVGYTSYGKGSVQEFFDLPDGSALKLTTARYYTPADRSIQGSGVRPDVYLGGQGQWRPWRDPEPLLAASEPAPEWVAADVDLHIALVALRDGESARAYFTPEEEAPSSSAEQGPPAASAASSDAD